MKARFKRSAVFSEPLNDERSLVGYNADTPEQGNHKHKGEDRQ
jgi:hypothetical protein